MKLRTYKRGQAIVEMAFVLPLFIVMLLAIYDFGQAFHIWSSLNQQCVEAARAGTPRANQLIARGVYGANTHVPIQTLRDTFWSRRSPLMATERYTTESPAITGVGVATNTITVSAGYRVSLVTPIISGILSSGVGSGDGEMTITATAEARKE